MQKTSLLLSLALASSLPNLALSASSIEVYQTSKDSAHRLSRLDNVPLRTLDPLTEKLNYIFVETSQTFQTVVGIGGALTDAAAETYYKLPLEKRKELINAYYNPTTGIGYSLGRTNISSSDFSSDTYFYIKDGDEALKTFSIEHDLKYRVPLIKEAIATAGQLTLFASPWSPPAWMKDNGDALHGGKLKPEYRQSYSRYYVEFIKAYEHAGIPIWGLTVQNEPMAKQTWESQQLTAEDERDFVRDYLGPQLAKSGMGNKKLMVWDHNRTFIFQRANVILSDPKAAQYIWGVAFHWYSDPAYQNLQQVHEAFPQTHLMLTEACLYPFNTAKMADWVNGENYGHAIIEDFNHGAEGWTDWNILLDEKGGPNHVGNFCFAPVHANTVTGELTYLNSFYYLGHFSKFIRPGAKRVISSSTKDTLETTAFINPDKSLAVVVLNTSETEEPIQLAIEQQSAAVVSPAHSITTYLMRP